MLARVRQTVQDKGSQLAIVHLGDAEQGQRLLEQYGLGDVPHVSDPEATLFRALGLTRMRVRDLFRPWVWWRGFRNFLRGHFQGKPAGDVMQMPGVFLIHRGEVLRAFRHATVADQPDYVGLACPIPTH